MAHPGWKALGSFLSGGNTPNEMVAEAQGEQLGANTENAIAQQKLKQQELEGRGDTEGAATAYGAARAAAAAALPGSTPPDTSTAFGKFVGALARGHIDLEQGPKSYSEDLGNALTGTIANPNQPEASRVAAAQARSPGGLANPLTDARGALLQAQASDVQGKAANEPGVGRLNTAKTGYYDRSPGAGAATAGLSDPQAQREFDELVHAGILDPASVTRAQLAPGAIHAMHMSVFHDQQLTAAPGAPGATGTATHEYPVADQNLAGGTLHKQALVSEGDIANMGPTHAGGRIRAGSGLINHMHLLSAAADAQDNNDLPAMQKIATSIGAELGGDVKTQAKLISQFVGGEMDTFLANGRGTGEGRTAAAANFNAADLGAKQLRTNSKLGINLIGGQADAIRQGYNAVHVNRQRFEDRFPILGAVLNEYDRNTPSAASPGAAAPGTVAPGAAVPATGGLPPGWTVVTH